MDGIREIIFHRDPKPREKISKGSDTGSITNEEAGDDGVERIFLEDSSPFRIRNDFKFYRHKDRTEHI